MLELGSVFAERYRLMTRRAEGGTATVYRAFDDEKEIQVALKVFENSTISPEILDEIWYRESQALERLRHPIIVDILSAGRDEKTGLRFIVIEWLEGESLEDRLEQSGALNWAQFYQNFGQQILDALTYAFTQNIIHRDLSINNILVLATGGLKIIDFGQAKLDDSIVGKTVGGWKTPPYCPPEDDSGRFSNTRDAFSFCAIAVRALSGQPILNHEELYEAVRAVQVSDHIRSTICAGLSRDPEQRPSSVVELASMISGDGEAKTSESEFEIAIRCIPSVLDSLQQVLNTDKHSVLEQLVDDLNDTISVSLLNDADDSNSTSFAVETPTFRLVADIDSDQKSHFVVVWAAKKRFSIDRLYGADRWMPAITFLPRVPSSQQSIEAAQSEIARFYGDFEHFLGATGQSKVLDDDIFSEWERLLQALRHIERTRDAPLRYQDAELSGRRLTVTVHNPEDAEEGQERTITHNRRWVFNGVIESLVGKECTLYSNWSSVREDTIPPKGELEMDWRQARVALDRQSEALEKVAQEAIPNKRIRSYITGEADPNVEKRFKSLSKFFDSQIDDEKKLIVSRFLATPDLLLIHGPPGTGKTTLIVELIRQQLGQRANAKILLVSQTHVAIDNVLEKLDRGDPELLPVRIGSGSKKLGERVAHCSVEARGRQLQSEVDDATELFLRSLAADQDVDFDEVKLGLRAFEVLGLRRRVAAAEEGITEISSELEALNASLATVDSTVTREETESRARIRVLENESDRSEIELSSIKDQLKVALDRLRSIGKNAKEVAAADLGNLVDWCELLLGSDRADLRELLELAEDWRLKFGQSDDFHVVIIAMAKVVAGTCVGFCRETAAMSTSFDLCIVDEASKATTTELLVPIAQAKKVVLVGDHHQLPAVIEHALTQPDLQEAYSLSARHLERQLFEALQEELPEAHKAELRMQYRMRSGIGNLISECFYDGELTTGPKVDERKVPDLSLAGITSAVTWIDTDPNHRWTAVEKRAGSSVENPHEVECIVGMLLRIAFLVQSGGSIPENYSVGVITGYSAQSRALNREIKKQPKLDILNIDCDTVHAFQGREVDVCIYSITRNNKRGDIGFLRDWRHLNVALSRARDYLVIVGGLTFCGKNDRDNPFRLLTNYVSDDSASNIVEWERE